MTWLQGQQEADRGHLASGIRIPFQRSRVACPWLRGW